MYRSKMQHFSFSVKSFLLNKKHIRKFPDFCKSGQKSSDFIAPYILSSQIVNPLHKCYIFLTDQQIDACNIIVCYLFSEISDGQRTTISLM